MSLHDQIGEHLKAAVRGLQSGKTIQLFGKTWAASPLHYGMRDGSVELRLMPVFDAPTVDKPAGGAPLELEGLKFTADSRGIKLQGPAHTRIPYGLTWKAATKLVAWLCVEVDEHRAPVAPTESPALHHQWLGRVDDLSPEALTAVVWSGEGLPPVGCVCEVQCADGGWHKCETIAHHLDNAVFAPDANYPYGVYDGLPAGRFRPLRTAEQIAAEAREAALKQIVELIESADSKDKTIAEALYDAGLRFPDAGYCKEDV